MAEACAVLSPYRPPGRVPQDAQLPLRPARRVLLDRPELVQLFTGAAPYRGGPELAHGEAPAEGEPVYVTVEQALAGLAERTLALSSGLASLGTFLRQTVHGAIEEGLRVAWSEGHRELTVTGGRLWQVEIGEGGVPTISLCPVVALAPLRVWLVAHGALVGSNPREAVPDDLASNGEAVVRLERGEVRADLLAVAPQGEDGRVEWYLFLGPRSGIKATALAARVPTPEVPREYLARVFPLARVVSQQGRSGVLEVEEVANRLRALTGTGA